MFKVPLNFRTFASIFDLTPIEEDFLLHLLLKAPALRSKIKQKNVLAIARHFLTWFSHSGRGPYNTGPDWDWAITDKKFLERLPASVCFYLDGAQTVSGLQSQLSPDRHFQHSSWWQSPCPRAGSQISITSWKEKLWLDQTPPDLVLPSLILNSGQLDDHKGYVAARRDLSKHWTLDLNKMSEVRTTCFVISRLLHKSDTNMTHLRKNYNINIFSVKCLMCWYDGNRNIFL